MPSPLFYALEKVLLPRHCVFCGVRNNPDENFVCGGCERDLPWIEQGGQPDVAPLPGASLSKSLPLVTVVAPLRYDFPIDRAIKALKFHRRLFYQPAFSEILLRAATRLPRDIDALLPVPLHWWRRLQRGFNQAEELTMPLSVAMSLPILRNIRRSKRTPYQSGLDAAERRRNLHAAFKVCGTIDAEHVLIVDDVITTGETCRQLARVLHAAGVKKVSALAVAQAGVSGQETAGLKL